ncbi:MAG TPA: AMP-binding protein [Solirubrobacterales bacterium]|nr:AMP-binding protein [Solirubrobacterales bacterium]
MWPASIAERNGRAFRDGLAVVDDRCRLTYGELAERSLRLASGLRRLGVRRGDRVALLSRNRAEVLESYLALGRIGAAAVPVNHGLVAPEVEYVLSECSVVGMLGEAPLLAGAASGLRFAIDFDGSGYRSLVRAEEIQPMPEPGLGDMAAILFTSATTGRPKGVVLSQGSLMSSSLSWLATARPAPGTTFLSAPPLFHSTVTIVFAYLAAGATVLLMRRFSPQLCLALVEEEKANHLYLVPSMVNYLLRAKGLGGADLTSVTDVIHGAAPMPGGLRRRAEEAFGAALRDCYGQAEAGGAITLGDPKPHSPQLRAKIEGEPGTCGRPLLGMTASILTGSGEEASAGELGEVCVHGRALMDGYWENPGATASVMRDGRLRTGDIGRLDEDGYLYLMDRRVDLIIRGGQNVYPAEIERVLHGHHGVADVAVVGAADEAVQEVPVAYVVAERGWPADAEELMLYAGARLASYKRPNHIEFVESLPRSPAGKILKKVLRGAREGESAG